MDLELDNDQLTMMSAMGISVPTQYANATGTTVEDEQSQLEDDELQELLDKYDGLYRPLPLRDFVPPKWANISLNKWIKSSIPAALFTGPRGTGKGTVVDQIAAQNGYLVLKVEFTEDVTPESLIGTSRFKMENGSGGDYFQPGPFIILHELEQLGVPVIMFCDEFNVTSPSAQMAFNCLTDKSGGFYCNALAKRFTLKRPKIAFAVNEGYLGVRDLQKSTRDRMLPQFAAYLPPTAESELIQKRTGCSKKLADKMVTAANMIRAAAMGQSDTKIDFDMSPRPLFEVGELVKMGTNENEAWTVCVIGRAGNSSRSEPTRMVLENLSKSAGFKVMGL